MPGPSGEGRLLPLLSSVPQSCSISSEIRVPVAQVVLLDESPSDIIDPDIVGVAGSAGPPEGLPVDDPGGVLKGVAERVADPAEVPAVFFEGALMVGERLDSVANGFEVAGLWWHQLGCPDCCDFLYCERRKTKIPAGVFVPNLNFEIFFNFFLFFFFFFFKFQKKNSDRHSCVPSLPHYFFFSQVVVDRPPKLPSNKKKKKQKMSQALKRTKSVRSPPQKKKVKKEKTKSDYERICGDDGYPDKEQLEFQVKEGRLECDLVALLGTVAEKWKQQREKVEQKKKKSSKPRKPTAYNLFFKKQMESPLIKALPHPQRMKAVAAQWKRLSPAAKNHWVAVSSVPKEEGSSTQED